MSYARSLAESRADNKTADTQIDGNSPDNTSPVLKGSADPGGAPMGGKKEFSAERTRRPDAPGSQHSFTRKRD